MSPPLTSTVRAKRSPAPSSGPVGDDAAKKFGNAKSISSDMYFGDKDSVGYLCFSFSVVSLIMSLVQETKDANLSRFQGSASISSDMYFNRCSLASSVFMTGPQ